MVKYNKTVTTCLIITSILLHKSGAKKEIKIKRKLKRNLNIHMKLFHKHKNMDLLRHFLEKIRNWKNLMN